MPTVSRRTCSAFRASARPSWENGVRFPSVSTMLAQKLSVGVSFVVGCESSAGENRNSSGGYAGRFDMNENVGNLRV